MPLRYLFVDMNAYFASVEQQFQPQLRGKPIAVVPVDANTSSCIAASYEAKAFGIRTGTPVWEAKQRCSKLITVLADHQRYVQVHKKIVKAVARCVPIKQVMSIDEMSCALLGAEREPANAMAIAHKIKAEIRRSAGDTLRCSIGIGPNVMLAKVAGDMQKPDGLTVMNDDDLSVKLPTLKLTDFPGIGPRMEKRFHRYGIVTVKQLLAQPMKMLSQVWGSKVLGERWYFLLRGDDVADVPTRRRTVSHSHVLPPQLRTDAGSRGVMVRLIHKAAARLRDIKHWTKTLTVGVRYVDGTRWDVACHLPLCQDTLNLLLAFGHLWEDRPQTSAPPLKVGMVLSDLVPADAATPSLFEQDRQVTKLSHVMDKVNRAFGKNSLHFGTLFGSEDAAPTRIAFTRIPEFNPAFV